MTDLLPRDRMRGIAVQAFDGASRQILDQLEPGEMTELYAQELREDLIVTVTIKIERGIRYSELKRKQQR